MKAIIGLFGCPLCGGYHKIAFHSYPYRYVVGSDGERSRIRVVTILCQTCRNNGESYTKRILPEHLIWRSPLSSKNLLELLETGADTNPGFISAACEALGCIDPRTARKHLKALRNIVGAKLPILAEFNASVRSSSEIPTFLPGTNPFVMIKILWDSFLKATVELSGSLAAAAIKPILWLGPGFEAFRYFNRSCIPSS